MDKNLYNDIKKNWEYLHPLTKGLAYLDYQVERLLREFESEFKGVLKKENLRFFYWAPRIAGISFIIFLSGIALEVFNGYDSLGLMINSLIARLMPSFLLSIMLLIAWKKEFLGGFLFIILFLALFALIISENPLPSDLIFFGPLLLIGTLFLTDSYIREVYGKGKV